MLINGEFDKIKKILVEFGEEWKDLAHMMGESLESIVQKQIDAYKNAQNIIKGGSGTSSSSSSSSNKGSSSSSGGGSIKTGGRVKVNNTSAAIYYASDSKKSSGSWKGAGVKAGENLYVVNSRNGRVALARSNNVNAALGWIDLRYVTGLKSGGYTGNWNGTDGKLAFLHQKERVLNAEQTESFDKMVTNLSVISPWMNTMVDFLRRFMLDKLNVTSSVGDTVTIKNDFVVTNNTPFEAKQFGSDFEKKIRQQLNRSGSKNLY